MSVAADELRLQRAKRKLEALSSFEWRASLERKGNGKYVGDERNVRLALQLDPELKDLVTFNTFTLGVEFARTPPWRAAGEGDPWTDDDDLLCQIHMQERDIEVRQRSAVADSVIAVAKEQSVHPVRIYLGLAAHSWDGRPRVDAWLADFLGAKDPPEYLKAVGSRWLIGAVARVMNPGCQVDHTLVLEGGQGIGKSSAARAIAVKPAWFTDHLPNLESKDAALQLSGRWIVELAELAAMRRTEIEATKAFLTRTQDVFRPPYGRRAVSVPRQSVFIATTNESQYLRDPTGNRRFWPVSCVAIDVEGLCRHRDQIWGEATARYLQGERWHLNADESTLAATEQSQRVLVTELEADVAGFLDRMAAQGNREVSVRDVFIGALNLDPSDHHFADACRRNGAEVAAAIQRAGWERVRSVGRGDKRRTLYAYKDSHR